MIMGQKIMPLAARKPSPFLPALPRFALLAGGVYDGVEGVELLEIVGEFLEGAVEEVGGGIR